MFTARQGKENTIASAMPKLWRAPREAHSLELSISALQKLIEEKKLACIRITDRDERSGYELTLDCTRLPRPFHGNRMGNWVPTRTSGNDIVQGRWSRD
jgi:hypothetical protein